MSTAEHLDPYGDTDVPHLQLVTTIPDTSAEIEKRRPHPVVVTSSSSSSARAWRLCVRTLTRVGAWISRRRWELLPAGGTAAVTGLGLAQPGGGPAFGYGVLAAGSAVAGWFALEHKNEPIARIAAGGTLALADVATAAACGLDWPTLTAYGLTTGAAYGVYGPWLATQRNARMKLQLDTVKAKGAMPAAMGLDAADPGLIGGTPEETALRRAIHALTGSAPADVLAFARTEHGWQALVVLPMGRNTSADSIIKRQAQFAANLGLPGRLLLRKGDAENLLVVRLSTLDPLAGTIPFVDNGVRTCTAPVLLGADDEGNAMTLDLMYRHTLIAGASDWGKSGILNLIIVRLAKCLDADLYGIDMKPGAPELGPWSPVMKVARNPHEARVLLEWIRDEAHRRGEILKALTQQALAEGKGPVRKWVPGKHGNAIFVFTDELGELVRQDPTLAELYESLLAIVRFLGIMFVSATQQPSRRVFGGSTDARGNYANRLSTRQGESGHAPFIFGAGCQSKGWRPEELDLPGKYLAQTPEHDQPRRVYRAQWVSDEVLADAVGFYYTDKRDTEPQPAITDEPWVEQFAPLRYPDGEPVGRDEWPDLYRVFAGLGSATKDELRAAGNYSSRDTVRRALEVWEGHGVRSRRDGRSTRFYLPDAKETTTA
ncbi:FtsK/SpoIIIE domain-containing protein [Streptomyces sp. NPDC051133]|uniref:FtsK/SpoIIIE domain-containing protein n=1 Tax=Streptomyces sp. NPDC051133 TaxID=3155521 RepID=UPI003412CBCD